VACGCYLQIFVADRLVIDVAHLKSPASFRNLQLLSPYFDLFARLEGVHSLMTQDASSPCEAASASEPTAAGALLVERPVEFVPALSETHLL